MLRKVSSVRSLSLIGSFFTARSELEKLLCDGSLYLAATLLFRKTKNHLVQDGLQANNLLRVQNIERDFSHFVTSMTAPDCFRLERLPGGPCTHWKAPPCHGARQKRKSPFIIRPILIGLLWAALLLRPQLPMPSSMPRFDP